MEQNNSNLDIIVKNRKQEVNAQGYAHGVGKRKSSIAKVWLKQGEGKFEINGKAHEEHFQGRKHHINHIKEPLNLFSDINLDIRADVKGGGHTGHAGSIRLAVSNALVKFNPSLYSDLRKAGLMTYDTRRVLRKKAGFVKHAKRKPTSRR